MTSDRYLNIFIALLILGLVVGIAVHLYNKCEVVNGYGHLYKKQCLDPNYKPRLVRLSARASYLKTHKSVDLLAKDGIEDLIADAEKDGMCLVVIGAYRSEADQRKILESGVGEVGALPGRSEHQTGLAVDFMGCPMKNGKRDDSVERPELAGPFASLPEYQWLVDHADLYGFEQSYREDNKRTTGYPAEPWHWKYTLE